MSPAALVLVMPVATVALPRDTDPPPRLAPSFSTSPDRHQFASDASYPVPSLPLHHARSCFRVYQRASPGGRPSSPAPPTPPTASDNEVSDLLRGCVDVDFRLDLLHQRRRRRHHHHHRHHHAEFSISCDKDRWPVVDVADPEPWQCVPLRDRVDTDDYLDDDELVQSGDVTVRAAASVMNAFYRPSLDFNKMQVSYIQQFLLAREIYSILKIHEMYI